MSVFKKIKDKVVNHFLAKFIDKFKTKNPAAFIMIQAGLTTVTITAGAVAALAQDWIEQIPILTETFPWLYQVDSWMAIAIGTCTYLLQIISGSSTPGTLKLVKFQTDHDDGSIEYKAGQRVYLKPKVADPLIEDEIATEVIITAPSTLKK